MTGVSWGLCFRHPFGLPRGLFSGAGVAEFSFEEDCAVRSANGDRPSTVGNRSCGTGSSIDAAGVSSNGVRPTGEAESLSLWEGDSEDAGVNSAFNRICRAVNSLLESTVEFTAVNPRCAIMTLLAAAVRCSESLCTRKSSHEVSCTSFAWLFSTGCAGVGASDCRNVSMSSVAKRSMARTGGELGIAVSRAFFFRFGLPPTGSDDLFLPFDGCTGVGGPGAGGGGIGAKGC